MQRVCVMLVLVAFAAGTLAAQKAKSKGDLLKEIATIGTANEDAMSKSYVLGKELVARFGTEKDEKVAKVKTFVEKYRMELFYRAVDAKKTDDAFRIGKEILAEQPDSGTVVLNLGYMGFVGISTGDTKYAADAILYTDQGIALIDAGKVTDGFAPFADKDQALAWCNYINAIASQNTDLPSGAAHMYKATTYQSDIKSTLDPYYYIAFYYEGIYEKASVELKKKIDAKTISVDDEKTAKAHVDKAVDLMMDAYARALKFGEAAKSPKVPEVKTRLGVVFKFRRGTSEGLDEYLKYTTSLPMPDPAVFK